MKKIIIFLLTFGFLYMPIVFADDSLDIDKWDIKCNEAKNDKTVKACEANVKFCWTDEYKTYSGCFFDKTDPLYGTTSLGADDWDDDDWKKPSASDSQRWLHQHGYYLQIPGKSDEYPTAETITDSLYYKGSPNDAWLNLYGMTFRIYKNIPVTKSYSGVDSKNKVASVGCYMGYAKVRKGHKTNQFYRNDEMVNPYETIAFDIVPEKCDYKKEQDCMGPVLVFKTFTAFDNNSCFAEFSRIILPTTFNAQEKYASTNLLKTSIAKDDNLKSAYIIKNNFQNDPSHGLYMTPWYVGISGSHVLSIDSSCKKNSDFCLKDLNRITTYQDAHASGRQATSWGFNIDANLGIYESAAVLNPDNPKCPEEFFIDPNESDYNYKFKLSNDKADVSKPVEDLNWLQRLFKGDTSGSSYNGCISNDEEGFKEIKECIEKEIKKINNASCPDNNDFITFTQNLKSIQSKCKADYKENDLYARFLMIEDNAVFDKQLQDAVNKKIDDCYDKTCNITEEERNKIDNELKKSENSTCSDGCRFTKKYEFSDSPDAKCVMCGSSQGTTYRWTEVSATGTCQVIDRVKEECFGTHKEQGCISCLKKVYNNIQLSEDKIKCLNDALLAKENNKNDSEDIIEDQSQEYTDEASQHNAEVGSTTRYEFHIPGMGDGGFGDKGQKCEDILKNNGIKIVKGIVNVLRIAGAIIAIANAMIVLIPAVISKDADGLKKAGRKLIVMAVVLAIIGILPSIIYLIGQLFGYDLTCIF